MTNVPSTDAWEAGAVPLSTRDFRTLHAQPGTDDRLYEAVVDLNAVSAVVEEPQGSALIVDGFALHVLEPYREVLAMMARSILGRER